MMQLKFLAIAIGLLAFTSCTDEPGLEISEKGTAQNENVNPLIEAAQKAYDLCYGNTTRSSASFFANDIVAQTYVKSRVASPDTVLYIVNEANGNGFVALTTGEHPEILAVSDNGTIKDVEGIDNPGLKMFFNAATEYASQYAHIPIIPVEPVEPIDPIPSFKEEIRVLEDQDCPARVKVQWGQSYPEGLFCPNKYSGCVITAAAQVLSYFEMPDTINLTYENADKEYINLNWFGFKKLVDSHS